MATIPAGYSVNSSGAVTAPTVSTEAQKGVQPANQSLATPIVSPYMQPSSAGSGSQNQYAVVTSKPANDQVNGIQNDYTTRIAPAVANSTATNAQNNAANSSLPVIDGYNVSSNPTGNQGETKATNNQTGQSYYITPQKPALSSTDVQSILTGTDTGVGSTTNLSTTPQTPVQTATAQTGINPTTENATYQSAIQGETDIITSTANQFQGIINSLSAGAIPFTAAQQSLIDATNSAFQQMTTQANLKAAALSSETGGVSDKVNAMGGQLIGIASDQAAAIAKLEVGFQTANFDERYKTVISAYDAFKTAETAKMDALTKIHDSVMQTYQNAVSAATAQQTFKETQFKDKQTLEQSQFEFRDMKDAFGNTIGTQVYDKKTGHVVSSTSNGSGMSDPSTGTLGTVSINPNTGAVDPTSQQAVLQTIPAPYRDMVWGIVNGKIEPPSARTAKGAQILSWVSKVDPTLSDGSGGFDATKYQARVTMQKSLASYTSGSLGQAVQSANKVVAHLASFLNDSASIPGKGAINPLGINRLTAGIAGGVGAMFGNTSGQRSESSAEQESRGLVDEMTKFFKGTGGTDVASIESWSKGLDPYASSGSLQGTIDGTIKLYSGQINSFINQYTSVMGHAPDMGTIIQPQTMATLSAFKDAGYNVDIPGVPYTNPVSYANASPDNKAELNAVRSQFPDLSPADALAQAQYNQSQGK